jgi:hypothetical protein
MDHIDMNRLKTGEINLGVGLNNSGMLYGLLTW